MKLDNDKCLIYLKKLSGFPVVLTFENGKVKFEYVNNTGVYSDEDINQEIQDYMDRELDKVNKKKKRKLFKWK